MKNIFASFGAKISETSKQWMLAEIPGVERAQAAIGPSPSALSQETVGQSSSALSQGMAGPSSSALSQGMVGSSSSAMRQEMMGPSASAPSEEVRPRECVGIVHQIYGVFKDGKTMNPVFSANLSLIHI